MWPALELEKAIVFNSYFLNNSKKFQNSDPYVFKMDSNIDSEKCR